MIEIEPRRQIEQMGKDQLLACEAPREHGDIGGQHATDIARHMQCPPSTSSAIANI